MKTFLLVIAVVALLTCIPRAEARNLSSVDGNVLLAKCHATIKMGEVSPKLTQEEWEAGFYCLGFVQGAMDADLIFQTAERKVYSAKSSTLVTYCVSENATWPQLVRVIVKWLEDNPSKLDLPGYDVINLSMNKAFPCSTVP